MTNTDRTVLSKTALELIDVKDDIKKIKNLIDMIGKLKKNFDWFCNKNYFKIA